MKSVNHKRGPEINIKPHGLKYQETRNPDKPTKTSLRAGKKRRMVEIFAEARDLGDELLDEWEK